MPRQLRDAMQPSKRKNFRETQLHSTYFPTNQAALDSPISVMETAGEGGAWGMALLASYFVNNTEERTLPDFLEADVFAGELGSRIEPEAADVEGFNKYLGKSPDRRGSREAPHPIKHSLPAK